ncbi:MAG TPA: YciI family protein [Bryobacteraceae bacterium]
MHYTILAFETKEDFAIRNDPDPVKRDEYWAAWPRYGNALRAAGVFVCGAGLQPPETAARIDFPDGQARVQDGPYADTKEQLGGFCVIDVPDLDTALEWAARCPRAPGRIVEVRPNVPPMS